MATAARSSSLLNVPVKVLALSVINDIAIPVDVGPTVDQHYRPHVGLGLRGIFSQGDGRSAVNCVTDNVQDTIYDHVAVISRVDR